MQGTVLIPSTSLYQWGLKRTGNQEMVANALCQDLPQRQAEESSGIQVVNNND